MARGAWDHTANLMCMMAEQWRDSEQQPEPFSPSEFHPMRQTPRKQPNVMPYNPAALEALQSSGKVTG